jgi:hypothetical protein
MTEQPTALRLADELKERKATHRTYSGTGKVTLVTGNSSDPLCRDAAAELRRLSALNGELLEALRVAVDSDLGRLWVWPESAKETWLTNARAAIARAEGKV